MLFCAAIFLGYKTNKPAIFKINANNLILNITFLSQFAQFWFSYLQVVIAGVSGDKTNQQNKQYNIAAQAAWHSATDPSSQSQSASLDSQRTIPWETKHSEWWQLKGNKPIIKSSKVAMRDRALFLPHSKQQSKQVSLSRIKQGVQSFLLAFFLLFFFSLLN